MMENPVIIEVEALIKEIEKMKNTAYESALYVKQDDPVIYTHFTARMLGIQAAYDDVICYLRRMQGGGEE